MLEDYVDISTVLRCGVYVLSYRGIVVYVGKSKSMLTRIYSHQNRAKHRASARLLFTSKRQQITGMKFDRIQVKPCMLSDIDRIESELIEHYKPRYNMRKKPLMSYEDSQTYLQSGIVQRIISGRDVSSKRPPRQIDPEFRRPIIDRRGF